MFDVVVIGGGPAGLSAALMLGRCRRRVLVCDLGEPRNRRSHALHGYLTRDGVAPLTLNEIGRGELATYGVEFRQAGVTDVRQVDGHYAVSTSDGAGEQARFILIATGVVDDLPGIGGISDCYGRSVFHCPYCDGWEWCERRLAALGSGTHGAGLALGLLTWSADVVLCTNGAPVDRQWRERLTRHGVAVRTEPVARFDHADGMLSSIAFERGDALPRDAVFFSTDQHPQSEIAVRLGCALSTRGTVRTGNKCDTNIPGVFVAGDASRDAQFVVVAAAEGVKAAVAINKAMQEEERR